MLLQFMSTQEGRSHFWIGGPGTILKEAIGTAYITALNNCQKHCVLSLFNVYFAKNATHSNKHLLGLKNN